MGSGEGSIIRTSSSMITDEQIRIGDKSHEKVKTLNCLGSLLIDKILFSRGKNV